MRVRFARRGAIALLLVTMAATFLVTVVPSPAGAQTLKCGTGGTAGKGSAGGYGVDGANGGNGIMPQCDQNTNGTAQPTLNCHAGGDAGEVVDKKPKEKVAGKGGVAANVGSSGKASARGGSEKDASGGLALATGPNGSAEANARAGPGGTALGLGSGTAKANGGRKGSTFLGRAGDGGTGTMPICQQNTNADGTVKGAAPAAAAAGQPGGAAKAGAARPFGVGGGVQPAGARRTASTGAFGTGGGVSLARTGSTTQSQLGAAGIAMLIGGALLLAAPPRQRRRLRAGSGLARS